MFNKNIEIEFQSAVHLSASVSAIIEAQTQQPLFTATENGQSTSYNFNFLQYYVLFWVIPDVMRE